VPGPQPLAGGTERDQRAVGLARAAGQLAKAAIDRLARCARRVEPALRLDRGRALGGREQCLGVASPLGDPPALGGSIARRGGRLAGRVLEGTHRLVGTDRQRTLRLREVLAEPCRKGDERLRANGQALARALQSVERAERALARAGGVRKLDLRRLPLTENRRQPLLRRPARERGRASACVGLGSTLLQRCEVERCDTCAQRRDLPHELLRTLGGGCLERQRPKPLPHLLLDVAGALDLCRDPSELQLGAMAAPLELPEPRSLLDERAPVLWLGREDRVDLPLGDDRMHRPAQADVRKQLDEIGAPNRGAVDEVLALAPSDEAPRDRHLAEVELLAEPAVLVVEHELDLAVVGRGPCRRAAEEDVVGPVRAELGRCERAGGPDDRVGDVRLAGPVGTDHDGDARLERDLDGVRERLEAAQLDGAQVHRAGSIVAAADGDQASAWGT